MDDKSNITEIEGDKFKKPGTKNPNKKIYRKNFNATNDGIRWGIAAGVGMALFLVAAQVLTNGESMVLKFLKYIALIAVLSYGLKLQKSYLQKDYTFGSGMQLGAIITAVSAITLALMNFIMFGISEELAFDKFSLEANSVGNTAVLSGVLFFEVLVFGMIVTFIVLQAIKPKRTGAEHPS